MAIKKKKRYFFKLWNFYNIFFFAKPPQSPGWEILTLNKELAKEIHSHLSETVPYSLLLLSKMHYGYSHSTRLHFCALIAGTLWVDILQYTELDILWHLKKKKEQNSPNSAYTVDRVQFYTPFNITFVNSSLKFIRLHDISFDMSWWRCRVALWTLAIIIIKMYIIVYNMKLYIKYMWSVHCRWQNMTKYWNAMQNQHKLVWKESKARSQKCGHLLGPLVISLLTP